MKCDPIAATLKDLKQRGLLDSTSVSQHGAKPSPVCLNFVEAGDGIKGG